jgi:CubicO group peptidase (beta-lactamase class C family)
MPPNSVDRRPLDRFVEEFAAERRCPTVAWGVVRNGRLDITGAIGDVDEHTVYRVASMTKSFSAAATLSLRDDGAFQLDDPIGRLVPELAPLRSPTTDAPAITIRDLLAMTSGLVADDAWADRHLDLTDQQFDAIVAAGPVFAEPTGTTYEYSNFGYAVLGRVIHRLTGRRIQQHISDRLIEPLGMTRTSWVMPPHDQWARPMRWLDDRFHDELPPLGDGLIAPMGGLWTTVADLATWISWLDDAFPARDDPDGGPLCRASRREMQASHQHVGVRTLGERHYQASYCLGLRGLHTAGRGQIISHSGGLPGYGSNMSWRLGRRLGVIALSNATYAPMTELGIRLLETVSDQLGMAASVRPVPAPLAVAAHHLVTLLNAWDPATADRLFTDNVRLDGSWDRRQAALEPIRPLTIQSLVAVNDARATVTCVSRDARQVTITFSLSPDDVAAIQEYEITSNERID